MKILLTLFVLFFSSLVVANKFDCDLKVHIKNNSTTDPNVVDGILYDKWTDLENYNVSIWVKDKQVVYQNNNEDWSEYPPNVYDIIKNDSRYIIGYLKEDFQNDSINIHNMFFDKKYNLLTSIYYSDYGIAIYEGFCK